MDPYALPGASQFDTITFTGNSQPTIGPESWYTWTKPFGKSMVSFVLIGAGGGGGAGAIAAAGAAGGGGGGGSGAMTVVEIPAALLPPVLYIAVGHATIGTSSNTIAPATWVSTQPNKVANNVIATAAAGTMGGTSLDATAASGGPAGLIANAAQMPLGWPYVKSVLAGQAGANGGSVSSGASVTLSLAGHHVTGGCGGGGLPASGTGAIGGGLTVPGTPSYFLAHIGGTGPTTATQPANNGKSGFNIRDAGFFSYGGSGGSSTHAAATGVGRVQSTGGNGGIGSGGGGGGGAITGSTPGGASYGGPGMVMITCY